MAKDETKRGMDSTEKILHHRDWLAKWIADPFSAFPIYVEITPASGCNHRCVFCAFDYLGYKKIKLPADILKERISEMAELGVKAVQYAGEGEPLLHPNMADIMVHTEKVGIEFSMLTNGVLLNKRFVDKALDSLSWFQVSLDAVTTKTHAKIHRTDEKDFGKIIKNLEYAVKFKKTNNLSCEIGVQQMLLPSNIHEAVTLARLLRNIGVDYFTLKPYSHHLLSEHSKEDVLGKDFSYKNLSYLEEKIKRVVGDKIDIDFRKTALDEIETERDYNRCFAVPTVWAYICADGAVYSCSAFLGDERFLLGNIKKQTFQEIWQGEKRKKHLEMMKDFDVCGNCRRICRENMTNKTLNLFNVIGPKPHRVNFI